MSNWVWVGVGVLAAVIAIVAGRDSNKPGAPTAAQGVAPQQSTAKNATASGPSSRAPSPSGAPAGKPAPGEPPEDVLLRFQRQEYDEINRAGGMRVTVSATGREIVLKPKLYSGRKDYCRPVPREPEGSYECGLDLMVTLREGDTKPGKHGERQFVHWDGVAGEWRRGLANERRRKSSQ